MHALQVNKGGINVEVADSLCKMHVEEKDNDMLELIYDEYPEEIEATNVHMVHGESLVVHTIIDTSLEEGEDWRQVENLLDISRETMPGVNSEIKKADSVSTIKTDSSERESNVELKKKQENLKASNSVKVMQPFRVKLLALDVKAKFAKDVTENLVPIILGEIGVAKIGESS